jgi:hypothetical protein
LISGAKIWDNHIPHKMILLFRGREIPILKGREEELKGREGKRKGH